MPASPVNRIEDAAQPLHCHSDTWISPNHTLPPPSDDNNIVTNTIKSLLDQESQFYPFQDYLHRCRTSSVHTTARQDSINWILKVHAYYHFSPVTALFSINYFDRFLSSHSLPGNGWPFQLLSVACLSLAAKMEEPQVPLLLDFQVLEPRFIFEPKTVQRMEIRVMSILDWRLRSITPFDFLPHFISLLPSTSDEDQLNHDAVFTVSSDLILRTTRVIDFMGFPPSAIAAAAVLCAAGKCPDGLVLYERVNQEMVRSCHQLMEEYLIDTCPLGKNWLVTVELPAGPPSPIGVLDAAAAACASCDTRSENQSSRSHAAAEDEPLAKRIRSSAPDVQQP